MERRDYLLHQIQEMGAFLARLVLRLKKKEHQPAAQVQAVSNELENRLDISLKDLFFIEDEAFTDLLYDKLRSSENMEQFAILLEQLGDVALEDETFLRQQIYYHKAIVILEYIENKSQNYSMERQDQLAGLRLKIKG